REGRRPQRSHPRGDVAPAGGLETLCAARVLHEHACTRLTLEHHGETRAGGTGERRGERQEDTGTVTGDAVGSPGTAVADGRQPCESSVEQLARGAPAHVRDQPDPARVALSG